MRCILILLLCQVIVIRVQSQVYDNFDDGNLTESPHWQGDLDDFVVNDQGELQLMANGEGESMLFTVFENHDEIFWEIYFRLEFSPSATNKLRLYLMLDNPDLDVANGYFLEVGENGSQDALNFYEIQEGKSSLIASGTMGSLGGKEAGARLKILKDKDRYWTVQADFSGGEKFRPEIEFYETDYNYDQNYFGLHCIYTASRADKFFFDDLKIDEILPDLIAPGLIEVTVLDPNNLVLFFNESLDRTIAEKTNHFDLDQGIGNPVSAILSEFGDQLNLSFGRALQSGIIYTLSYRKLEDLNGNIADGFTEVFLVEEPQASDLIINEILFNPEAGGSDFVEIYNRSGKFLSLKKIELYNASNEQYTNIVFPLIIHPDSFIAWSEDVDFLKNQYVIMNEEALIEQDLPAFNNDAGNVTLRKKVDDVSITLDSFNFDENMHFALLDDREGVSLERIHPDLETNLTNNWQSAASVAGYATPGYQNSNYLVINPNTVGEINLQKKIFSPNQDGIDDQLIIEYSLDSGGYILNLKIFDSNGREVKVLAGGEKLATSGIIVWDGTNQGNQISEIGVYVLWIELFTPDGVVKREKRSVILADYLD